MRIYIVPADVQNRDEYSDYTTRPPEKLFFPLTVREDTENKYGEHVSIMGVYSTLAQAEHRWVDILPRMNAGDSRYYDYFGLPNILEALGKWDKQYGMDNEIGRC